MARLKNKRILYLGGRLDMPKFCTKCGNKLGDGDLFCGNCGAPVANTNEQRLKTIMPQEIPTTQKEEEDKE